MSIKPRRTKTAAAAVPVPQNRDDATAALREIGERQRTLAQITVAMSEEMAAIKEKWEALAQPEQHRIDALTQGLQIFADANRDALTGGGKTKTVALPSGEICWRLRPPSVRITGAEAVLDALRRAGLWRFIREKQEVNREAILAEPEAVVGVTGIAISQGEDFVVTPHAEELSKAEVA